MKPVRTVREQLNTLYPAHADRIVEIIIEQNLLTPLLDKPMAFATILNTFCWNDTTEGFDYWRDLYNNTHKDQAI